MRMSRKESAVVAMLGLAACGGPTYIVQQYHGPPRPPETIAVLRVNGNDSLRLLAIDDETVPGALDGDARLHVELLPGRHSVIAANMNARVPGTWVGMPEEVIFAVQMGKVYRIIRVRPQNDTAPYVMTLHVFEVDRGSDAPIREAR